MRGGVPVDVVARPVPVGMADQERNLVGGPVRRWGGDAEVVVVAEGDALVPDHHEHRGAEQVELRHPVHQPAHEIVDLLDVVGVGPAHLLLLVAAPAQLHEPAVHRAEPLVLHLAGLDVDGWGRGGVERVERIDGEEEGGVASQPPELAHAGTEGGVGRARLALDRRQQLGVDGRFGAGGGPSRRSGPLHIRKALALENRVVAHVRGGDPVAAQRLRDHRLPVPDRVEARHRSEPLGPLPVPERERAHAGDQRPPRGQRRHGLGDHTVEAQRVAGEVVEVRGVRRRAALEGLDVVGPDERQDDDHHVASLVLVGLGRSRGG